MSDFYETSFKNGGANLNDVIEFKFATDYQKLAERHIADIDIALGRQDLLKGTKGLAMMFYKPDCPHCKKLQKQWRKIAQKNNDNVLFGAVNCNDFVNKNNILNHYFQINAFPTIAFSYDNGKTFPEKKSSGDVKDIISFLSKEVGVCQDLNPYDIVAEYNEYKGGGNDRTNLLKHFLQNNAKVMSGGAKGKSINKKKDYLKEMFKKRYGGVIG